jgi:hypothetical protein
MRTLLLSPEGPALNATIGRGVRGTGGEIALNVVRDRKNTAKALPVTWIVGGIEFDYLMAFYRRATKRGVLPFLIDLPLQDRTMSRHKACFSPGSLNIRSNAPLLYEVTAQLMVVPQ